MENDTDGVCAAEEVKTELQRELELFEAAEREEFLTVIRPERQHDAEEEEKAVPAVPAVPAPLAGPCNRGRRKRGRKPQPQPQPQPRKKVEEDVCFVCYDGGDLVLCDRRSCPKAYHPSCVGRDEAFFRTRGSWTCGWHLCTLCGKPAKFMCYACTYSVCKACIKEAEFVCVRRNRGFCESCIQLTLMIEENKEINSEGAKVDFSDKETWEYLFKDYWLELKGKLSLTLEELKNAKNPFKDTEDFVEDDSHSDETFDEEAESASSSDSEFEQFVEEKHNLGTKRRRRSRTLVSGEDDDVEMEQEARNKETSVPRELSGWASKELMEFIGYVSEDTKNPLSSLDIQCLLLTYIKQNKLQDPCNKSQIICNDRLQNLFGKSTVGHSELLKIIESHFTSKHLCLVEGNSNNENEDGLANNDNNQAVLDDSRERVGRIVTEKRRKPRKKAEDKLPKSNPSDYAAINVHNISLIYLRRALIEDLLEDLTSFNDNVVGSFVRIRISGMGNRPELCYRLVQIVGTRKVEEAYNTGRKMTDFVLEVLNLSKKEDVSIDSVSNQDFTEEECKRLRQSIRCGLVNRPTVGELEEKAKALHEVKLNDWFETELLRLSHLRDRASEKGRRKELRECVEKLQLLSSPEERTRKLEAMPEVIADPDVGLDYDSDEDKAPENSQDTYSNQWEKGLPKRRWDGHCPGRRVSGEHWDNAPRNSRKIWNNNKRSTSAWGNSGWERGQCAAGTLADDKCFHSWFHDQGDNDDQTSKISSWSWGNERDEAEHKFNDSEAHKGWSRVDGVNNTANGLGEKNTHKSNGWSKQEWGQTRKASSSGAEFSIRADPCVLEGTGETEKVWHYQDPTGTIQGPFSMVQLRKWNTTGFFPLDLRIWKTHERQEDSILLTDAMAGKFCKVSNIWQAKSHVKQTPLGNKTGMRGGNSGTGWRGNSTPTWRGLERSDASRRSNWQVGSGLGSSTNAEMKRSSGYQSVGWDNGVNISQSIKSDTDGWVAPQSSGNTWRAPSNVEAPKPINEGWGGSPNDGWSASKSPANNWPPPSTIEAPTSTNGVWSGPENTLPIPYVDEDPKSARGGGDGCSGEDWGACPESPWKPPAVVPVAISKPTNEAWVAPQSSENTLSASVSIEVPKLPRKGWNGGPSEAWGPTQCPESLWKTPSTVTIEPPKSAKVGWDGGPNESWVAPVSSANMWLNCTTAEAPNHEKEGWGATQCSENMWSTPSTVEAPRSAMGGWVGGPTDDRGAPQLSENLWSNPQAVQASKSANEGLGAAQSSENLWTGPSTVEAPKSANEGWGTFQSSEHQWTTPATVEATIATNGGWGGAPSDSWGGGPSSGGRPTPTTIEAPNTSNGGWGSAPCDGQGGGLSGGGQIAPTTVEAPNATNRGWGGAPNDGHGGSVEALNATNGGWGGAPSDGHGGSLAGGGWTAPATVEAPNATNGGWGGAPSDGRVGCPSGGVWTAPTTVEAPNATNGGWGGVLSDGRGGGPSSVGWTAPATVEAPNATNGGWGGPLSNSQGDGPSSGCWTTPTTVEAPNATNGGWGGATSGGGWNQPFSRTGSVDTKVGGMEVWNSQTNYCPDSAGKFHSRPPNDGFRPSRNSRKDIPCKFHGRGFCKKGISCEFRHG